MRDAVMKQTEEMDMANDTIEEGGDADADAAADIFKNIFLEDAADNDDGLMSLVHKRKTQMIKLKTLKTKM